MKVNMNQMSDDSSASKKKPAFGKSKNRKSPVPSSAEKKENSGGNVYKESLNMYKEKWAGNDGILHRNKFWIGIAVVLFFVFVAVNSNTNNAKTQLTIQLKRMESETTALNDAINEVKTDLEEQAKIDAIKLTDEEEELAKYNAIEQGTKVEVLQNAYRKIVPPEDSEELDDAEYKKLNDKYIEDLEHNKKELNVYFGENDKNAQTEWYPSIAGIPGTWEFASKAPFSGNTAKVLWLCYADEDHTLLAYCTATYHADTKLFTNVEWKMTSYAAANIKSDDETATDTEQITSVQDALKALSESGDFDVQSADEEFDEETINNNNAVSEGRNSYKDAVSKGDIEGEEYDEQYNVGLDSSDSDTSEAVGSDTDKTESDSSEPDKTDTDEAERSENE